MKIGKCPFNCFHSWWCKPKEEKVCKDFIGTCPKAHGKMKELTRQGIWRIFKCRVCGYQMAVQEEQ